MAIETYLGLQPTVGHPLLAESQAPEKTDDSLEKLVHLKSKILGRKLDILATEIWWRFRIVAKNLTRLDDDKTRIQEMLASLDTASNYHWREHSEKGIFYRKLFDIEVEKRSQEAECWRDVVMVMRDFLVAWEAHEQSKSRAIFLQHVGSGTEGYL